MALKETHVLQVSHKASENCSSVYFSMSVTATHFRGETFYFPEFSDSCNIQLKIL